MTEHTHDTSLRPTSTSMRPTRPTSDAHQRRRELTSRSSTNASSIRHTTLQVDHESWQPLVQIEAAAVR